MKLISKSLIENDSHFPKTHVLTHYGLVMLSDHRTLSTLAQVMPCCLTAPSHCLNQSWLAISEAQWHSPESNEQWVRQLLFCITSLKIIILTLLAYPRGQCVNSSFPTAPSHYLNQHWLNINWTLSNKLQWNFNQNTKPFIHDNVFEHSVCEMAAILSQPQCVNSLRQNDAYMSRQSNHHWFR